MAITISIARGEVTTEHSSSNAARRYDDGYHVSRPRCLLQALSLLLIPNTVFGCQLHKLHGHVEGVVYIITSKIPVRWPGQCYGFTVSLIFKYCGGIGLY